MITKFLRLLIVVIIAFNIQLTAIAQSLSVNITGNPADASAILDVESSLKGVLIPRMDKTQKNAIASPANGLLVYQTGPDSTGFHYYDQPNTRWVFINASGYAVDSLTWKISGNSNITAAHFLGTTNDSALRFRIKNEASGILDSASANTSLGFKSLSGISTGLNNTALGFRAGENLGPGTQNVLLGSGAFQSHTSGTGNTASGNAAMGGGTSGSFNTAMGDSALWATGADGNTALGYNAGNNNNTGTFNTLLGYNADVSATTLTNASAIGTNAVVGQNNSLVLGSINGLNGATSTVTVGIGNSSPNARLHVTRNGASGVASFLDPGIIMEDNTTSYLEFAHPAANTTGILSSNPAGVRSGVIFAADSSVQLRAGGNTTRLYIDNAGNTGVNRTPMDSVSAGTLQVQNAGNFDDILGLWNNVGQRWTYYVPDVAPDLYLYFSGVFKGSWNNVNGNYSPVSDRRSKKDISEYNYGLKTVKALVPYKYHYLDNKFTDHLSVGFMAQDVLKLYPEAVYSHFEKDGKETYTMDYQAFSVLSIKAIQEQQKIIEGQQKAIDDLLKRIEKLEKK